MSEWREVETSSVSALMRRLREYHKGIPPLRSETFWPRPFVPSPDGDFDVNSILKVFDLVHLEPGYVLDYIYLVDHLGGQPFLYARPINGARVTSKGEYSERFQVEMPDLLLGGEPTDDDSRPYLDHMEFKKTDIGFLQFALFCMTARRFQLCWHSHYNNRIYILDDEERSERLRTRKFDWLEISEEELRAFAFLDVRPKIQMYGDRGWVRLLTYELRRGLSYCIIELRCPNRLRRILDDVIVESSNSRFMY